MTTCNHTIIKAAFTSGLLNTNGVRATGLQIRIAGSECCAISNIVDIVVPPCVLPPTSNPNTCIQSDIDLYGYTAIAAYDPVNCKGGHCCDMALFDLYFNDTFIGQANLNNSSDGGARSGVFIINDHILTNNLTIKLQCAYDWCHQGIGSVIIEDPNGNTIFSKCLPNDQDIFIGGCCFSGLYRSGYNKSYGERDDHWNIVALPQGIDPPESQTLPYSAYIYDPMDQSPTGFPTAWNNFIELIPSAQWIGPSSLINSIYPYPTDYNIIYSTNIYVPKSGTFSLSLVAYPDNYASGFIDGSIDYSDPMKPTIINGSLLEFDNSIDGLISTQTTLSSGNHELFMVVNDTGAAIGLLVDSSGCSPTEPVAMITSNGTNPIYSDTLNTDIDSNHTFNVASYYYSQDAFFKITPIKTPLTVHINDTNGQGCGDKWAQIFKYSGVTPVDGIAAYYNLASNNLPLDNYTVVLNNDQEYIYMTCPWRYINPESCVPTFLTFKLSFD